MLNNNIRETRIFLCRGNGKVDVTNRREEGKKKKKNATFTFSLSFLLVVLTRSNGYSIA